MTTPGIEVGDKVRHIRTGETGTLREIKSGQQRQSVRVLWDRSGTVGIGWLDHLVRVPEKDEERP